MTKPTAIDPLDCGCTECITGQYVPLDSANDDQIAALLRGDLDDHTGVTFEVVVSCEVEPGKQSFAQTAPSKVKVSIVGGGRTWSFSPYLLPNLVAKP